MERGGQNCKHHIVCHGLKSSSTPSFQIITRVIRTPTSAAALVTPSGKALPCHAAETIPGLEFWNVRDHSFADI
jgi:hypothetical protein